MEKSIAVLHGALCNRIRGETDEGIISRLRRICEDEGARKAVLEMLTLKPGDQWYEVATDIEFTMVE